MAIIDGLNRRMQTGVQPLNTLDNDVVPYFANHTVMRSGRIAKTDAEYTTLQGSTGEGVVVYNLYSRVSSQKVGGQWVIVDQTLPVHTYYIDSVSNKLYYISQFDVCTEFTVSSVINRS